MTLDQQHYSSTVPSMMYNSNSDNGGTLNNSMINSNQRLSNNRNVVNGQTNVQSSPLLTYSYLQQQQNAFEGNNGNGGVKMNDQMVMPQLSLSLLNLSLNGDQESLISTSTSPGKVSFGNHLVQPPSPHNHHHHHQSLSLDSSMVSPHQRDLSSRFDAPFANSRQRGNSNGFPPIGGHLTSKYCLIKIGSHPPETSPRLDVSTTGYPQTGTSNGASRYQHSPIGGVVTTGVGYTSNDNGFVGSPLLGGSNTPTSARQKQTSSYIVSSGNNGVTYTTSYGSHQNNLLPEQIDSPFGMMPPHMSPSASPSNSPRHVDFGSPNSGKQQLVRAMVQGGRSNSMPPIPAFSSSSVYTKNDGDIDRMNNYISKSVNMKILEEDEQDSFADSTPFGSGNWYPANNTMGNPYGLPSSVGSLGYGDEQYIVGHMEMSPSQGSPLSTSYQGYMDGGSGYSSPSMGYKMPMQNGYNKYANPSMNLQVFSGPNTSNITIATANYNQGNQNEQSVSPTNSNDGTDSSDGDGKGHKHPGEYPSRTLFVRNISSNVDDQELRQLFESFGHIRHMYTSCKHRGFVMITYFDIRHAKQAKKNLQSKLIKKRKIDIHYSIPKDNPPEKEQLNQETLVVFNLDPSITNEELKTIFTQFGGDVKEIRETPNKKFHKFIEFYDTRDAERALKQLNKSEIKGKKIKIEYSRPGGLRNRYPSGDSNSSDSPTTVSISGLPTVDGLEISSSSLPASSTNQLDASMSPPKNDSLLHPGSKSRRPRAVSAEEKEQFKLDLEKVRCGIDKRTTLMVKNIPNKYTQKMLLETVDVEFKTSYDFFYLPIDFKNKCNVGYAFINFIDPKCIIPFVEKFNNKKWEKFNSEKVCDITYARIQGKNGLINHFQNSSLMCEEEDCRPIFYSI